jgi:4-amino-4-deoxy-L-arabinose transferase-like glycosyltransferase
VPSQTPSNQNLAATTLIVLAVLWSLALFLRASPYTPDEPREFDIAWNMLQQPDKTVPLLAGEPFCEKPPLTYWVAAASMGAFGATLWAARLPNLLWAAITILCLFSWMRSVVPRADREKALVFAGLIAGSSLLLFRVQIWLATDAPLVAATSIALLGAWRGFFATTTRARFSGYLLFHLGLAAAFFAKNLLGWLVPIGALLGMVAWERRWRELLRWELYAGLALQLVLIVPWVLAVANRSDGARLLRIFLIDNTLGRLLPIATEDEYQLGHSNHPGKYLIELLYYLLPWTFAAIGALRWAVC